MERKYRSTKKAIMVLGIIAILLIGVIVYQQIRITGVKAEQDEYWEEQHALKEQELADAKAEYESKDLKEVEAELKEESKYWKDYSKAIVKAFEKDEDIDAVIAEYEGTAEDETTEVDVEETEEPVETEEPEESKKPTATKEPEESKKPAATEEPEESEEPAEDDDSDEE